MKEIDHESILREMAKRTRVMKPAIAGVVIDRKVDYKEVFSTFVHLAVWGHIQAVPGRKFVRSGKKGRLAGFERLVLESVFSDDGPVPEKEIVKRLESVDLHEFSGKVLDELISLGLAEGSATVSLSGPSRSSRITKRIDIAADGERIAPGSMPEGRPSKAVITRSTVSRSTSHGGEAVKDMLDGTLPDGPKTISLLDYIKGLFKPKVTKKVVISGTMARSFMGGKPPEDPEGLPKRMGSGGMRVSVNGKPVTDPEELQRYRKMFGNMGLATGPLETGEFSFSQTEKADGIVAEYLELQDFLKRFPCAEDRFSNPFVAYNIAFHLRDFKKLPA